MRRGVHDGETTAKSQAKGQTPFLNLKTKEAKEKLIKYFTLFTRNNKK
jgi:hypothetical protein